MTLLALIIAIVLEFQPIFVSDENGRPLLVTVVKGTFTIPDDDVSAPLAEKQEPVELAGKYWGDPEASSHKYEPEVAFEKPATDVVLIGTATPPKSGLTEMEVGFRVGPVKKIARVTGERVWRSTLRIKSMSKPAPLEPVPLIAERAFGGWDRTPENEKKHRFEPRNPVGVGFRSGKGKFEEGVPLPNVEDPRDKVKAYEQRVRPATFGFTGPHWEPRSKLAGTYDQKWSDSRMPLLPTDFDRRFFNAASPGLIAPGHLRGDEPVSMFNVSGRAQCAFQLPGLPAPEIRVVLARGEDSVLQTKLDTVIVNADEKRLFLIWRANLTLRQGPLDVATMELAPIASEATGRRRSTVRT